MKRRNKSGYILEQYRHYSVSLRNTSPCKQESKETTPSEISIILDWDKMVRLSIKHIKLSWQVFFNTGRSISISISNDLVYCFSTVYESSDKKQSICAVCIYIFLKYLWFLNALKVRLRKYSNSHFSTVLDMICDTKLEVFKLFLTDRVLLMALWTKIQT